MNNAYTRATEFQEREKEREKVGNISSAGIEK